jgi:hypothetical protein
LLAQEEKEVQNKSICLYKKTLVLQKKEKMKFVAAPLILAILAASTAVDAVFSPPKANGVVSSLSQYPGWLLGNTLRGGSMGKHCRIQLSVASC